MPSLASLAGSAYIPVVAQSATAGVAAPSAGTAIATATTPPLGLYRAHVWTRAIGATDEPKDHNMELRAGATVLIGSLQSAAKRGGYQSVGRAFQLDGSTSVTVNATANATASTTYVASFVLERVA